MKISFISFHSLVQWILITLEGCEFLKTHFINLTLRLNSEFHYLWHAFIFLQIFMSINFSSLKFGFLHIKVDDEIIGSLTYALCQHCGITFSLHRLLITNASEQGQNRNHPYHDPDSTKILFTLITSCLNDCNFLFFL